MLRQKQWDGAKEALARHAASATEDALSAGGSAGRGSTASALPQPGSPPEPRTTWKSDEEAAIKKLMDEEWNKPLYMPERFAAVDLSSSDEEDIRKIMISLLRVPQRHARR